MTACDARGTARRPRGSFWRRQVLLFCSSKEGAMGFALHGKNIVRAPLDGDGWCGPSKKRAPLDGDGWWSRASPIPCAPTFLTARTVFFAVRNVGARRRCTSSAGRRRCASSHGGRCASRSTVQGEMHILHHWREWQPDERPLYSGQRV